EIDHFEREDLKIVRDAQRKAWEAYRAPVDADVKQTLAFIDRLGTAADARNELARNQAPYRRDALRALTTAIVQAGGAPEEITDWLRNAQRQGDQRYDTHLYSEGDDSALKVPEAAAEYADDAPLLNGFEIINHCFDHALRRDSRVIVFGEDVGKLG